MRASVQLLGPVQLRVRGELVDLRGARQQRLLAVLALHHGAVVSTDRVIDAVWAEGELPPDPRSTLRTYLSRLRHSFDDAHAIESRDGGYCLSIAETVVDRATFEAYLADADRVSLPARRADLLGAALDLWNGPALDGLAHEPWARPEAARLDELRAVSLERRAEALLDDGQVDLAISELQGAVCAYPHREALVALLMSALDRRGRRAEALRAYNEYWHRLATDVGLEPGEDIVGLERRIAAGGAADPARVPLRGYELGERIGEGAFAIVYRATQPSVGRTVAIKQIRSELANRPEFIRRFEAEAQLVARLEHPHIVPLYDYWREPDSAFLVMRWLRGGSLAQALLDGPWPVERAVKMITEIGRATQVAHRAGVVHRDIKPENVLLDDEGASYLTDFGIALEHSDGADPDAALSIGSPAYASPEQLRREQVGPASDVWGLGITLFETLTARLPFAETTTRAELLDAQLHRRAPSVRSFRPDIPRSLDDVISRSLAKDPADRFPTAAQFVEALENSLADIEPVSVPRSRAASTALPAAVNPYKGLRAFDEADAREFHGRARLVDEITTRLVLDGPTSRFVLLVGPSGSGKSSVVRAGLVPALRADRVDGSARWFYTTMTPGSHPFEELEAALLRVAVNPPPSLLEQLQADDRGLLRASMRVVADDHSDVVIVIDQFEELFTMCDDVARRSRFLDMLVTTISDPASRVRIVATLRADFYDRPLEHQSFAGLARDHTIVVAPLAPDELEHAIVDPAASAGCEFEPGLVAVIVAEVGDQPGALPLLQFALTSMYDRQVSGLLTLDAYQRMGGLTGAIAERAEQLYSGGDAEFQRACRHVFTRLVTLGQGVPDTRRRVHRTEFGSGSAVDDVLDAFGSSRLLSFDHDRATREPTVELAHEALIRDWPRLRRWLDDDREGLQMHRHLTASAVAWDARGRESGDLYRGGRLESVASWAETHHDQLNEDEAAFLAASTEQQRAERQREHQRVVRLRALLATVAVVAVLALIAGATALVQRRHANTAREQAELEAAAAMSERDRADDASADSDLQRRLAEIAAEESDIRRLVAEAPDQLGADEEVALLMALEAYRRSSSNATLGALQQVLVGLPRGWLGTMHGSMIYDKVSSSGDGSVVAATGKAGVDVFDLQTKRVLATFPHDDVVAVDVSADGSLVAAASINGEWWILSVPDLEVVDRGAGAAVTDLEFAPTGMALALGHVDGTVDVHDSSLSRTVGRLDSAVLTMAWRHDADLIIAGGGVEQSARVFDAVAGGQVGNDLVAEAGGLTNGSTAVAFLSDDAVVANGPVVRFDVGSGDEIDRIDDVDVRVVGYLHPVGPDSLIAIGQGGAVDLLDFGAGSTTRVAELGGGVGDATISDDRTLVTPWDDSLLITDLTGARVLASSVPLSFADRKTAAISDDGSVVVSGFNGEHSWWRPGAPPAELGRMDATYARIRGNDLWIGTVLQADGTGMFQMWTAGGGLEPALPSPGIVSTIGLSSDGGTIVLPGEPTRTVVHVMDRRSGATLAVLDEFTKAVPESETSVRKIASDVEFDPNGDRMVVATIGGAWGVWDTDDWSLIRPIENGLDRIMDLDFSADGRIVASITVFGELTIRDAADFTILAGPIAAHRSASSGGKAVSITNDGRLVVTDGDDGAKLWDIDTLEQIGSVFPDEAPVQAAELAKDANLLATVVGEEVVLWNIDTSTWFEVGCRAVARSMTRAEWDQFGPVDQPYVATCESVLAQI